MTNKKKTYFVQLIIYLLSLTFFFFMRTCSNNLEFLTRIMKMTDSNILNKDLQMISIPEEIITTIVMMTLWR